MKKETMLFISGYDNSDKYVNGFIQLYNLLSESREYNTFLIKVDRVWKSLNLNYQNINIFLPFTKFDFWSFFKKLFISMPKFSHDIDTIIFDSDPYSILIHKEIIKFYRPKRIIYRQSDPMILIDQRGLLAKYELELMKSSNQIWVANSIIMNRMKKYNLFNVHVLENPIKLPLTMNTEVGTLYKSSLIDKVEKIKNSFLSIGVFYGKFDIDFELISDVAKQIDKTAFLVIGDYTCTDTLPNNVILIPYQPLEDIVMVIKMSDFFFIPNKIIGLSDIFFMSSKILMATKLEKPIIAQGISSELKKFNIYVGDSSDYFIDKIKNLKSLLLPKVDLDIYSEEAFLNTAVSYLKKGEK